MKFLVCFLALVVVACAVPAEEWTQFKMKHGKKPLNHTHELKRLQNYKKNKELIEECNKSNLGFKCDVNHLTDLSHEEVQVMHKGLSVPKSVADEVERSKGKLHSTKAPNAPASVDWRTRQGVVGPVKNQGTCGSCYTFSANAALESQLAIRYGQPNLNLAEQQLVDCLSTGCDGGWMNNVFQYIQSTGVTHTNYYPYVGVKRGCPNISGFWKAYTKGFRDVTPRGSDAALMEAVANIGPVAIAIDADGPFNSYSGGVYYNPYCTTRATHAMTLVGYGNDQYEGPYWLVKNSWGTGWGENGYVRISRRAPNHCGISSYASYPIV